MHDGAERVALQNREIALMELEQEVRSEIRSLRAVEHMGTDAQRLDIRALMQVRGEELDQYRAELLRVRGKLAALDS